MSSEHAEIAQATSYAVAAQGPETRITLKLSARRGSTFVAASVPFLIVGFALGVTWCAMVGVIAVTLGIWLVTRVAWQYRLLRKHPWVVESARVRHIPAYRGGRTSVVFPALGDAVYNLARIEWTDPDLREANRNLLVAGDKNAFVVATTDRYALFTATTAGPIIRQRAMAASHRRPRRKTY